MAQWVPKTAWRVVSLTRTYGPQEIGIAADHKGVAVKSTAPFFAMSIQKPLRALGFDSTTKGNLSNSALLKQLARRKVPFVDLREDFAVRSSPIAALPLHPHDLLSGACNDILPEDKDAIIVVVADTHRRALSGFDALRRHGYDNVILSDTATAREALAR
jgi:rhodanese-related sulfurtransferase